MGERNKKAYKLNKEIGALTPKTFSALHIARGILRERAQEFIEQYLQIVAEARVAGDYESAYKALQWLIDHIPADETGERVVERSVDKVPSEGGNNSGAPPAIQIGIALGGLTPQPKKLPKASVIDATVEKE